jgi:hypothetical protein
MFARQQKRALGQAGEVTVHVVCPPPPTSAGLSQIGWHIAGNLQVPASMRIVLLPPCSPELNHAEHPWEALRGDGFANTVVRDLDVAQRALDDGLIDLESIAPDAIRAARGA